MNKQLGMGVRLEPKLSRIRLPFQQSKPSPVQATYWIDYQFLDHGRWQNLSAAERQQRTLNVSDSFLRQFRQHPWRGPVSEDLPGILSSFLFGSPQVAARYGDIYSASSSSRSEFILALSTNTTGIPGLANVPWELTADLLDPKRPIGLNPGVTLCRLIEETPDTHIQLSQSGPLKLFYVISNREPLFTQEAETYRQSLSKFGDRMRPVVEVSNPGTGLQPSYEEVVQSIGAFSPHILIYVGHGRTTDQGTAQLEFEDWVDVYRFAERIKRQNNQPFLVILISCDTSWSAAQDPDKCGPYAFISSGIPAVVTMQSKVSVDFAIKFLDRLLPSLFSGAALPGCVTQARQGDLTTIRQTTDSNLEWAVPALFVSKTAFDVIQPLKDWKEAYKIQFSAIEARFPAVGKVLPRPELENTVSNWLDERQGVACITGIFGSGRTTLVSKVCREKYNLASERTQPPPRPIIYINVSGLPLHNLGAIVTEANRLSKVYDLKPISLEGQMEDLERLSNIIDLLEPKVLILDEADFLSPDEFRSLCEHCKAHLSHGLLFLIVSNRAIDSRALAQIRTLQIGPFSQNETVLYCTSILGQDENLGMQWYQQSGGNLFNLSLLGLYGSTGDLHAESFSLMSPLEEEAKTYVDWLQSNFASDLFNLLVSIAIIPGGLRKSWIAEIFGSDALRLYEELSVQGLLITGGRYDDWVQVPTLVGLGLERLDNERRPVSGVFSSVASFVRDCGPDWKLIGRLPNELEKYPGFLDFFRGLQVFSLAIGVFDYAVSLTRLVFDVLHHLGRESEARDLIETLLEGIGMDHWEAEDLLRLASALHALGDVNYLTTVLDYLDEYGIDQTSDDYYKVTFWNLRANSLKDQAARERTNEMFAMYENAEVLAGSHLEDPNPADWLMQLALTQHNKALTLRYMRRDLPTALETLKQAAQLAQQAAQLTQQADCWVLKAKSDMERAEIELDIPGHDPDWGIVEDLLSSARDTFRKYSAREKLAFCLYQIARMHKKKPDFSVREAIKAYNECQQQASQIGLVRLSAIALKHCTELERKQAAISPDEAIKNLDSVIGTLRKFTGDAWSTRVLRDSQLLAARICLDMGKPENAKARLIEAWTLAFQTNLLPGRKGSDRSRAASIAVCWIEHFGWPTDDQWVSRIHELLNNREQQLSLDLNELKQISQEVE